MNTADILRQLSQWESFCSVAGESGICPRPAVDPTYPLKICAMHLGLALGLAITRFTSAADFDEPADVPAEGNDHGQGKR